MAEEVAVGGDGPNRIMVYLRIRPANKGEIDPANGTHYLLDIQPDNKTAVLESKNYSYDWIFNGDNVQQEEIYKKVAEPVLDNVFKGFWGTIMVYGQTGSGKSFTMCSFEPKPPGIIPRTMKHIFNTIDNDPDRVYTVCFSFIQIYLDRLQDLFAPEEPELKINRDKNGVSFPGIKEHIVKDAADFKRLYDDGNQYRVITATKMNPESSRGHAALFIQVKSVPRDDPSGECRSGKLFLIDLAGYERFSKTGVQEGLMAQEAKTINASLLSLGNVVQALSDKAEHVPWRNAKLTRMLEDAIGGRAKCSIILTAGPSSDHLHETLGTLYFGSRAMAVKTNAKLTVNVDYKKLAAKLQEMLNQAEGRINALEVEATRRQLEREEAEGAFQSEWARVKKRQEDQLQKLLVDGATKDKIEELIRANQQENDLLEEQQYQQRQALEERHEEEVQSSISKQTEAISRTNEESTASMSRDMTELQRQLTYERTEKEKFKTRCKEAESEARRLLVELNEAKMKLEGDDLLAAVPAASGGGGPASPGSPRMTGDLKREFEKRIETVRAMLEDNFTLKLAEVEEPLREELEKYKKMYEDTKHRLDSDLQVQKDALTTAYESEIADLRRTSAEVQEKLKKNHLTIKKSYQDQREQVSRENEELSTYVDQLTAQITKLGAVPVKRPASTAATAESGDTNKVTPSQAGGDSPAGKDGDRYVQSLLQKIKDMQSELDYVNAEKEGLTKQSSANVSKSTGEERLSPAQLRALKAENEELKHAKQGMEVELMRLKAAQILSGPQEVGSGDSDDDEDDEQEELHGDQEGLATFTNKLLARAFFDASTFANTFQQIATTLTPDLDDYRRILKYRLFFFGMSNVGKSSVVKCMLNNTPIIKTVPEVVTPTIHPQVSLTSIDDLYCSKTDWHKAYVLFQDVEAPQQASGGLLNALNPLSVFSSQQVKGVADPAKVYLELVDMPGERSFLRALPSNMLPSKNVVYCIAYDLAQPLETIKVHLGAQLTRLHASVSRSYNKLVGGDAPRVGFCLIGTRRDEMRDKSETFVVGFLNKIVMSLGDVFFRLRGEDTAGLVCIGNFATSARDWSVTSTKGDRGPKTFRDLAQLLGAVATQLYPNTPTNMLPSSKESASHVTYMMGDDVMENVVEKTSHLLPVQQRMRKGMITFLTGLLREQKARWAMSEADLRKLISEHLEVNPATSFGNRCVNYVIREIAVRGIIVVIPQAIIEPKYLPKSNEDPGSKKQLPREGVVVLDPYRLMMMYSLFMTPASVAKHMASSVTLQQQPKEAIRSFGFDPAELLKLLPACQRGLIAQEILQLVFASQTKFFNQDVKLLAEFLSVLGLGLSLRAEAAVVSPGHIVPTISKCLTEYIPYLISLHGDGIGRRYRLNASTKAFFGRLQTKLIPFSIAPSKDANLTKLNWSDTSLLVLEKTRLKWGIFGSRAVKEAVMQVATPLRGILKIEGELLFVAVTAKGSDSTAMVNASRIVLDAIHKEIILLCSREFRGVKASFQELTVAGCEAKRSHVAEGIETILSRHQVPVSEIAEQRNIVGTFTKGREIEDAIQALRPEFCDDDE